jgi:hypothetical protein
LRRDAEQLDHGSPPGGFLENIHPPSLSYICANQWVVVGNLP